MKQNKGQIWVETVIYTLIALILIGAVLAFIAPKIQEIQDKSVIEQSTKILQDINQIVSSVVLGGPGNKRIVDVRIKRGSLTIDGKKNKIFFEIDSSYDYSQEGENISIGDITALTKKLGSSNKITLTSSYNNYNLTYEGKDESKTITQASIPYKLSIENKGGTKITIDFSFS